MIEGKKGFAKWLWILIVLIVILIGYVIYIKYFGVSNADFLKNVPAGVKTPPAFPSG